jgi:alpha-tubulin suppressor-like RCC1 family protein
MEEIKKESAPEVPVQEQIKVTFEYLIERPSKVFLTNNKSYFEHLVKNFETICLFEPKINAFNKLAKQFRINEFNFGYLVQVLLDKQGNLLKKASQAE